MPVALILVVFASAGLCVYARLHGIVYLGRTQAGWTTVRNDTRTIGELIRVLVIDGTYQSATFLDERWADPVFYYHRLFDHLFDAWPAGDGPRTIAVLGGGGYAIPKHLVVYHPEIEHVDVVEVDPKVEQLARQHFFVDQLEARYQAESTGRLRLHVDDALSWLEASDETFDVIINDCFSALEPERTLMTAHAAHVLNEHLNHGGLYLTNVVSALEGAQSNVLYATIQAITCAFKYVYVYPCCGDRPLLCDNNVVIATQERHDFPGAWEWPT